MSVGCAIVATETAPVQEVLEDQKHGLLFDFFDTDALVAKVCQVLEKPQDFLPMREQARDRAIQRYDLQSICLPRWLSLLT